MVCAVCLSICLVTMLLNLKDCMFPINKIRHVNMLVKYWVLSFSVPCFRENHDLKFCRQSEAILVYHQVTPKDKTPRLVSWYVPDSCSIAVQRLQLVSICNASTFNNVWMCYKKGSRSKYFLLCRLLLSCSVGFVHPSVPEETVLVVWYQSDLLIFFSGLRNWSHLYWGNHTSCANTQLPRSQWSDLSDICKDHMKPLRTLLLAATKQLYEWYFLSVCPSVTPFWLCSHHCIIMKFSGVITKDQGKVHAKCHGQGSKVKVTEVTTQLNRFWTVTPVWFRIWWWNYTYSLILLRRGALLFLKVIRQISRSHAAKNRRIWPRLGVSGL